ncbi:Anthranilate synthase component I [Sagittula stellata E-37]|uniref:Anthranilate synthase component I n=1 Tax=Sagittula stellata (strain ATCC 700073 / DSM 11524 / E-37) TaxID=388399 RepID=A3JZX8_SAGS3|nr:Anthranilate synthase component I [Sagittula stellata E-37]
MVLAGLFVFKIFKRLDQDWYRCRALAESVKTSTWRFSMRAHPFEDTSSIEVPKTNFRNLLKDILQTNRHIAANLETSVTEQVTGSMIEIRKLPLNQRMDYYVRNRIDNQQAWYSKKSTASKAALSFWVVATIVLYIIAAIALNAEQLGLPSATLAFDPLIVIVTSALGWLQMKRHGELMASYNLTAHEIGILLGDLEAVKTEDEFSDLINEAELAFSREHTQWVARRDAN